MDFRLFKMEPEAKILFGFDKDACIDSELTKHPTFVRHAKHFIRMFDKAVELLGPDVELLTDIMLDLGAKHATYGVKPEYYPSMGRALIEVIRELLGDSWNNITEQAWFEMYGAISYDMIRAQQKAHVKPAEPHYVRQLSSNVSI